MHEAASYRLRFEEEDGRRIQGEGSPGVKTGSRGFGGDTCEAREGDSGTNIVVMKLVMFLLAMRTYCEPVYCCELGMWKNE